MRLLGPHHVTREKGSHQPNILGRGPLSFFVTSKAHIFQKGTVIESPSPAHLVEAPISFTLFSKNFIVALREFVAELLLRCSNSSGDR